METYTIKDVLISIKGKKKASMTEALVNIDLSRIEVAVAEVVLSSDTIGLLGLNSKEFDVIGKVDSKILIVERAVINGYIFDAQQGEPVILRDISILGLRAKWETAK